MTMPIETNLDIDDGNNPFTPSVLEELLPNDRADLFFDALLGDPSEGAYDIRLAFKARHDDRLEFELQLHQRAGKCLACNLTYGLPEVFRRHPVINLNQVVKRIDELLGGDDQISGWTLGRTREVSRELHTIPLTLSLTEPII